MIKILLKHANSVFEGRYGVYVRFILSGGTAAVADLGLLFVFTDVVGMWYLSSAVLAFILSFFVSFTLQKFWTFRDHRVNASVVRTQSGLYLIFAVANLCLNTFLMYLFVDIFGWWYLASQFVAGVAISFVSFFAYRQFIFHREISLRQFFTIAWGSFKTVFRSLSILGFSRWIGFWLFPKADEIVELDGVKVSIRGGSLRQRVVDLFVSTYCILDREYNPDGFEIKEGDTVLDIGGHIGSFTLASAGKARKGRFFVFEPDGQNFGRLEQNIFVNSFSHVTAVNNAVGSKRGEMVFYRDDRNDSSSSFSRPVGDGVRVKMTTLRDIFENNRIETCDFMKLDCEGSEYDIIFSAPKDIFSRIKKMAIEVHDARYFNLNPETHTKERLIEHLNHLGYVCRVEQETNLHDLIFATRGA